MPQKPVNTGPVMDAPEGGAKMVGPSTMTVAEINRKNSEYWQQWGPDNRIHNLDATSRSESELARLVKDYAQAAEEAGKNGDWDKVRQLEDKITSLTEEGYTHNE